MFISILFLLLSPSHEAYSFCPKCIYSSGRTDTCNLFKQHPLCKDNPEVNFIGKEICGEKGKYFKCVRGDEEEEDNHGNKENTKNQVYKEEIIRMIRD